jgi:NADPH-dependent F420 reductase
VNIGIVGGTGDLGEGIAMRLSSSFDVIIGSRDVEKAEMSCRCCEEIVCKTGLSCTLLGASNQEAVDCADVVILAIPFPHLVSTLSTLKGFSGKVVISPVNPLVKKEYFAFVPPAEGSAAMLVKKMLPGAKVCSAFNAIAANKWRALDEELEYSVPVCGDDPDAKRQVMGIVNRISRLKAFNAGPLEASAMVESLTPLLLNIARYNYLRDVGIQFR